MSGPYALVIGGGIFGITAALELQRRGRQVTLLDPGPIPNPAASSTDISKAVRMDYGADEFYMQLMERCFSVWVRWNEEFSRPLYHQDGFLLLSKSPMGPGSFEYESWTRLTGRGHQPVRLDQGMHKNYPMWGGDYIDGYFNPIAGWAESGEVVAALMQIAKQLGVDIRERVTVESIMESDHRTEGVVTGSGERFAAENTLVCAGTWTPHLLPELAAHMWTVGQPVFHFRPKNGLDYSPPQFPVWAAEIGSSGWYGFPVNADGVVKVANHGPGRRMLPQAQALPTPEEEQSVREFLKESIPNLAAAPITGRRVCYYCDTWDGDFYITPHPDRKGLFISTGGSGHAFKFAPVLGELAADVIEGKTHPYGERFLWRNPGDRVTEAARYKG